MSEKLIQLYNIGYQGLLIDEFLTILIKNNIETVIDIRRNPYSRYKDFSRKRLSNSLSASNIEYHHCEELGSPDKIRLQLKQDGDYSSFFEYYTEHLNTQSDTLIDLLNLVSHKTVCLLCMEHDINICHRKAVISKLQQLAAPELKIDSLNL